MILWQEFFTGLYVNHFNILDIIKNKKFETNNGRSIVSE